MREAIILAGGFGTRLSHVVSDVPKPMAPVAGKPFLDYLLSRLSAQGFEHIVLSTGYMHNVIADHYGASFGGMKISYAVEETPLGTGGGIRNALQACGEERVVVLNGDTLFDVDFDSLYSFHDQKEADFSLFLRFVDDTSRYGSVAIADDGRVLAFAEKKEAAGPGYINGGIYLLNHSLLDGYAVGEKFSFENDVLQAKHRDMCFYALPSDAYFIDIGIPADYYRAQKELPLLR